VARERAPGVGAGAPAARRSTTEAARATEVRACGGGVWGCGGGCASRTHSARRVLEEEEARLLLPEVRNRPSRGRVFELRGSNFLIFVLAG
jgi:hypothetical protein